MTLALRALRRAGSCKRAPARAACAKGKWSAEADLQRAGGRFGSDVAQVEDPCVAAIAAIGWHEEQAAVAMDGPRAPVQRELIFDSEADYLVCA